MTPLDMLIQALRGAGAYAQAAEAAPVAILWSDPGGEFGPLLPSLRMRMPNLLTMGAHDPATRTGPGLWLRAAADRQLPGQAPSDAWPVGVPPVIYLPGVRREVLRGAEDCPDPLKLLVWFAVAGCFFGQPKQARDWSLRGFLAAGGSPVALDVPDDAATRAALARAATRLFNEPVDALRGKRWDAAALDGLLVADPDADMLAWIDGALTPEADPDRFVAFAGLAAKRFGFDPRKKSRHDAAALLARREKNWAHVWHRFAQGRTGNEEVVRLLGFHEPVDLLAPPDAYPAENARREASLRTVLLAQAGRPHAEAVKAILQLEADHHWRRATVWADRGQARLAQALEHLAILAAAPALPHHDPAALAVAYMGTGWQADDAALRAMAAVQGEDRAAVHAALRTLHLPRLEAGAIALQTLANAGTVPFTVPTTLSKPPPRAVLVFVDGLRMDLAHRLSALLRGQGATVALDWRWSGFPSVTATCKPLASPAAGLLQAGSPQDLLPLWDGKAVTKPVLMKAIEAAGWATQASLLPEAPLWFEASSVDKAGEANGAGLLTLLPGIMGEIAETVLALARQGRPVRIVTDHGFLLMPGGLEKADLPGQFVEPSAKARRVALLKEGAPNTYDALPWSWNPAVLLATARGARTFYANVEYAHGGVSPQECVLPVLDVTVGAVEAAPAVEVRWRRLMAKVRVKGGAGLMADIRVGAGTSGPSALLKGPKELDDAGEANLGIDDAHGGAALCVVIYRANAMDEVVALLPTQAGS